MARSRKRPRRRRRGAGLDADLLPADADHEFEAQLQVELALRKAERAADKGRKRGQRAAFRRFAALVLVLALALIGLAYLILTSFRHLFG